ITITASAVGAKDEPSEKTNPLLNARAKIKIPEACTGDTVEVTYDFTEIADLIKADPKAPGWTVKQRHRAPEPCDTDGEGAPDPDFGVQCPADATGTYPNCSCPAGEYDAFSNTCPVVCTSAQLKIYETRLIITDHYPKGCSFSTEQSDLDIGVEWFLVVGHRKRVPHHFCEGRGGPRTRGL
ncbi:MAG: hypothetical protein ACO3N2_08925, partial [Arenicellales bacterium]